MDPADGDTDPRRPARLRCPRQPPRHRPGRRRQGVPRSARQAVPRVRRRRSFRRQGAWSWRRCRRSCSSASTTPCRRRRRDGTRREWRAVAETVAATTAWQPPDIPASATPARSTAPPPWPDSTRPGPPTRVFPSIRVFATGHVGAKHSDGAGLTSRSSRRSWPIARRARVARPRRHLGAAGRRQDDDRAARPARRSVARRRQDRHARAAPAGDTSGGAADGRTGRRAGRRDRRLPDARRTPHRAGDANRGPHRGSADPPGAARSRTAGRRRRDLRRGPRAQPDHRPRPRPDPRRRRDDSSGSAHPGDVGDRRHGTVRPPPRSRAATDAAPVIEVDGRTHPIDIRWLPRQRNDRLESAVASAVARALGEIDGDVLVFLPGIGEIMRCRGRLARDRRQRRSTCARSPAP